MVSKEELLMDSDALALASTVRRFVESAEDREEFKRAIAEGRTDDAISMSDFTRDEFHDFVEDWRQLSNKVGEKYPSILREG